MTETRIEAERGLQTGSEAGLRFRLWIGQNPFLFVLLAMLIGFGVARIMGSGR